MKSHHYNFTKAPFNKDMLLIDFFYIQASKSPDQIAVYFHSEKLTYKQLQKQAGILAQSLINKGVKPGDLVGLCIERSCNLIVGVLGILKAGAGYVPLDPEYPQERLEYMIKTAQMPLLITNKHLSNKIPTTEAEKILI